jgi:hypothetical protein
MVSHPTALPLCSSFSAQAAASELLPNPAGALTTPRFGSSDVMAKSGGRATSPPNRAGTIFVVRNGSRPLPGKVPVLDERWLKRGWIKGPPTGYGLPPFGGIGSGENVRSLSARRKGGHRQCIPSRLRVGPKQADVYQGCTLRFLTDKGMPRKAGWFRAKSCG